MNLRMKINDLRKGFLISKLWSFINRNLEITTKLKVLEIYSNLLKIKRRN